jgi:cyanophycin synthetase
MPESLKDLQQTWNEAAGSGKPLLEVMLYVALALQRNLSVRPAVFGSVLGISGASAQVALQCETPEIGAAAWQLAATAAGLFHAMPADSRTAPEPIRAAIAAHANFFDLAESLGLDQLTVALLRAAERRDIPWYRLGYPHCFVQLGQGRHGHRLHETMLDSTRHFAVRLAANKAATHQLLQRLGFPQPAQILVQNQDQAVHAAQSVGYPMVLKPCHGAKGRAVSVGLATPEQVRQAFQAAAQGGDSVVVESLVAGDDHRLLVVGGRLIAGARRLPAFIVGDGKSSVAELLATLNRDPRRGRGYRKLMQIVELDGEARDVLASQGCDPGSVPAENRRVLLRRTANVSRGGIAEDVTDIMHADNVRLAEEVARVVGLDVTGIDFLTTDISRSWREVGGGIIEVNPNPGLRPHWIDNPRQRDVVGPILDLVIPHGTSARIPTVGVTGSLGKTTTCRMVAHILEAAGRTVGLSTTQGTYVGGRLLAGGDHAGGKAAVNLMLHPDVEAGVFELARGGLIRAGLVLDSVDVGVVLNVLDNHIGLDGVTSRDGLARVKRLVVENATRLAVLNADDPLCLAMRPHLHSQQLCLVSRSPNNATIVSHLAGGGCAVVVDGADASATIRLLRDGEELGVLNVADIPATLGGAAMGKAVNAAFAIAVGQGLGIPFATSARALRDFHPSFEGNPGRLNLIEDLPFTALIDWPDGPVAIAELVGVASRLPIEGRRILLLTAGGNRPDDFLRASGCAAASVFDAYLCSNYTDLRGRKADEVPALLREGLLQGGVAAGAVRCIPDFEEALNEARTLVGKGDLLVVASFSTELVFRGIVPNR